MQTKYCYICPEVENMKKKNKTKQNKKQTNVNKSYFQTTGHSVLCTILWSSNSNVIRLLAQRPFLTP